MIDSSGGSHHIGTAGYPRGSRNPLHALEILHDNGLNGLEVQFVRQARMGEDKARRIGERAREMGILLSAHAPYYVSLNSKRMETVRKSINWIVRTAEIAHHMGAWVVVIHAASYSGKPSKSATAAVTRGVGECRQTMDAAGIDVKMGLETMGKKGSWGRLEEIARVMEEVEGVIPVLDFAHIHALTGGGLRREEDFASVIEECEAFYEGHLHCHFSSIEYSDRGERHHLPLDHREPDFSLLVPALDGRDFTIICETPDPLQDALKMKAALAPIERHRP